MNAAGRDFLSGTIRYRFGMPLTIRTGHGMTRIASAFRWPRSVKTVLNAHLDRDERYATTMWAYQPEKEVSVIETTGIGTSRIRGLAHQ
jgi:hypothetical protein